MMFANVVNVLQQFTGISVAASRVSAPALLRATMNVSRQYRSEVNRIKSASPWMQTRLDQSSYEMQVAIGQILIGRGITDKLERGKALIDQNAYFLQSYAQNWVDVVVWSASYDDAVAAGMEETDAVAKADSDVRLTQGSFAPEDISRFEAGTPASRLFSQFYGYFGMLGNLLGSEAGKALRDSGFPSTAPRLIGVWLAVVTVPAVMSALMADGAPGDDDDEDGDGTLDEWMAMFFGSQGRTLAAMVPHAGAVTQLFANGMDENPTNDRLNVSASLAYFERSVIGVGHMLGGSMTDGDITKKDLREALAILGLAGIPTGQLSKSAGYLLDVEQGNAQPESTGDFIAGLLRGR